MALRIACLHTAESNVGVFETALTELGRDHDVILIHTVRPDLLEEAEAAGDLTAEIARRTADALLTLCGEADAVVLTCSTLGPSVPIAAGQRPRAVILRVDEALAREAVRGGGKVVALCAVETTLEPTRTLFERSARGTGAAVEVCLVPGAWAAFKAGDHERYLDLVAAASDAALRRGASRVALAQASMSGAAAHARTEPRPLTSPAEGLRAAIAAAAV